MTTEDLTDELRSIQPPFADLLGITITSATATRIEAEMPVIKAICNRNDVLHGGALMALADNMGGTATAFHLRPGDTTSTIESKTNFMKPLPLGDVAYACTTPLHLGWRTLVWQTAITRRDGKMAGMVTQTQIIIRA
ncbi:hypothetical protein ATO6_19765 [Oceanicola sp. 22II-s10i]|uniref:PaaI family thioesterase n=1 Tax=Oceanicola sp. 22II-s10i TaxID=1317116 RepID=UPI000B520C77|nr:PaaI family thioesterase [Oceanicola sp. 22II-s10i]OWU83106.1 hypothetical protein ATO6_19765 [Oceanicola sp. 22II-s10i]